jgi:glycosyltransferase involved in cell wall biosynthesis
VNNFGQILHVVNKELPPGDYRIRYGLRSKHFNMLYGMPQKTRGLPDSSYVWMNFNEGWRFSDTLAFCNLYRFLRKHHLELRLVHFYTTNLSLFGPLLAYFAGVRSVVTLTGFGRVFTGSGLVYRILKPIYLFFLGISIRRSERFFFQNRSDLQQVSSRYPMQAGKFVWVGSAADVPVSKWKDFSVPTLRVILIARLMPDKGILDFARVAEQMIKTEWEFILIGPPSTGYRDLHRKVVEWNRRGIISYKGECSYEDIQKELARSHVYFFPSSYGEGMSRTMLEAGFGLLCPIAYDIPANRDVVSQGRGFLLPIGDVGEVVSLLHVLRNARRLLSENARSYQAYIVSNYHIQKYTDRMDGLLMELLAVDAAAQEPRLR